MNVRALPIAKPPLDEATARRPASPTARVPVELDEAGRRRAATDAVAVEEPLEIRVQFQDDTSSTSLAVTMRTPGDDLALAVGFLVSEGLVREPADLVAGAPERPGDCARDAANTITVTLARSRSGATELADHARRSYVTSSCGICGTASLEALRALAPKASPDAWPNASPARAGSRGAEGAARAAPFVIERDRLTHLPEALRAEQHTFDATGGLHAAALFDRRGDLVVVREDVGRHNAVDKVIGDRLLERAKGAWPLHASALLVSGRASFELVQKAVLAGIPLLAAIGAPSSLAVESAREFGLTLVGFLRADRFNVYAHGERVRGASR